MDARTMLPASIKARTIAVGRCVISLSRVSESATQVNEVSTMNATNMSDFGIRDVEE